MMTDENVEAMVEAAYHEGFLDAHEGSARFEAEREADSYWKLSDARAALASTTQGTGAFCNKCGFMGPASEADNHKRPDGTPCPYSGGIVSDSEVEDFNDFIARTRDTQEVVYDMPDDGVCDDHGRFMCKRCIKPVEQPDAQGTDSGLADEVTQADIRAAAVHWVGQKDRETFMDDIIYAEQNWSTIIPVKRLAEAFARHRRTDRKAVLEEAAEVADEIAEEWGNRWREMNGRKNSYDGGRIAGWSDGAADVAKSIRALAEGSGK